LGKLKDFYLKKYKCTYVVLFALPIFILGCKEKTIKIVKPVEVGQKIDSLNSVYVFYNGTISNVSGRNVSSDSYNIGLKYQCVEFVKRYYYEYLDHKMPNSYGHAKGFFNKRLSDGKMNNDRNLIQYTNGSKSRPRVNDLLIFDGTSLINTGMWL